MAMSMLVGRRRMAEVVVEVAGVGVGDHIVDVGSGPGTALRVSAARGASATGVEPSAVARRLGRMVTRLARVHDVTFIEGRAEALPLPDGQASAVWALQSLHHWTDRRAGLAETIRVLAPGGRLVLAEREVAPGARGHGAHGLTRDAVRALEMDLGSAGFQGITTQGHRAGSRQLLVVTATRPPADGGSLT